MFRKTLLLVLILLSVSYAPVLKPFRGTTLPRGHRLSRGLVAYWLMNEGIGNKVYDLSGNGNYGTIVGDTHFAPGKFGSALDFDGDVDYVEIPDSPSVSPSAITMSVWFNTTQSTVSYSKQLVSKSNSYALYRNQKSANNRLMLYIKSGGSSKFLEGIAPTAINDGAWHFAVGTYTNGYGKVYLDNILLNDGYIGGTTIDNNSNTLYFSSASSTSAFEGLMDHVGIWNRALSASEIAELYRDPFAMFRAPSFLWDIGAAGPVGAAQIIIISM